MPARSSAARVLSVAPSSSRTAPAAVRKPRLFHARMLVTRAEEWCVEAASAEEARELLVAGAGHRCTPGESVQIEFEHLLDD